MFGHEKSESTARKIGKWPRETRICRGRDECEPMPGNRSGAYPVTPVDVGILGHARCDLNSHLGGKRDEATNNPHRDGHLA